MIFEGWELQSQEQLSDLEERIESAESQQETTVSMPWNEQSLPIDDAKSLLKNWQKKIETLESDTDKDITEPEKEPFCRLSKILSTRLI